MIIRYIIHQETEVAASNVVPSGLCGRTGWCLELPKLNIRLGSGNMQICYLQITGFQTSIMTQIAAVTPYLIDFLQT